ncbi:agmatine/peptidylarginine deiminase [Pararhodobacter sp. CCB-MM2]|uniref:agmatine deiminase family protein n=1 Tax=Pararhodobacter sp. CCB-MM2 TaxID=1786003 RepID=UPI00082D7E85|nr:agmatine deiminase family protein [Pararhodobacter sp. CCB-MM2]
MTVWTMPPETAPQDRVWMAFPREGQTLGETSAEREAGYAAWAAVAHAVSAFAPVSMICDPSEMSRAHAMLGSGIEVIDHPLGEFWLRDFGPTFAHDAAGQLAAVDWIFNGWGGAEWSEGGRDNALAAFIAGLVGAPVIPSLLVNEGGGLHVDGEGTLLLTETVQLDPGRNPLADKRRVEAEMARTLGISKTIWLPRGLSRDYDTFGTRGHVDIVATFPQPGMVLLHDQRNAGHPDHALSTELRALLSQQTDAYGRRLEVIDLPAPEAQRDAHGFVDYSYVNHLVCNDGVIACGFGEEQADARAAAILAEAYPGRKIVTVDARELFARGGGIHCITQQQPSPRSGATGP